MRIPFDGTDRRAWHSCAANFASFVRRENWRVCGGGDVTGCRGRDKREGACRLLFAEGCSRVLLSRGMSVRD